MSHHLPPSVYFQLTQLVWLLPLILLLACSVLHLLRNRRPEGWLLLAGCLLQLLGAIASTLFTAAFIAKGGLPTPVFQVVSALLTLVRVGGALFFAGGFLWLVLAWRRPAPTAG